MPGGLGRGSWGLGTQFQEGGPGTCGSPPGPQPARGVCVCVRPVGPRGACAPGALLLRAFSAHPLTRCRSVSPRPHLLQQRQLAEELVGAVLGQEVGPLLAGPGIGAIEVLEEAGLGQGGCDAVLALLVVGQRQPVAPGQPPGEALQGRKTKPRRVPSRLGQGGGVGPGPGPRSLAQLEPHGKSLPPAAVLGRGCLSWSFHGWGCLHASLNPAPVPGHVPAPPWPQSQGGGVL